MAPPARQTWHEGVYRDAELKMNRCRIRRAPHGSDEVWSLIGRFSIDWHPRVAKPDLRRVTGSVSSPVRAIVTGEEIVGGHLGRSTARAVLSLHADRGVRASHCTSGALK